MNIVISGFYGLHNTGDEAILSSMISNLRRVFPNCHITVLSLSPEETANTYGVTSIYRGWRRDNMQKWRALRNADVLLSGGGGLLQDTYPTKFLFGPLPYYLLIVLLAKLARTPVMFFSQGIGPVTSRWGKFLMRRIANRADLITVRDEFSAQHLKELRVTRPPTVVTADVVFAMEPRDDENRIATDLALDDDTRYVVVAPRPWFEHEETYISQLAQSLDDLIIEQQIVPVFVIMESPADLHVCERIQQQMQYANETLIARQSYRPDEIAHFIGNATLVISVRLHALIFAAIQHVPHIGLSYDPKVEAFLKRSTMWDFSCALDRVDAKTLTKNATTLMEQRERYAQQIAKEAAHLTAEAKENFTLLQQFVQDQH